MFHYDGATWNQMALPSGTYRLFSIWGSSSLGINGKANDVFTVCLNGKALRYNGSVWSPMTVPRTLFSEVFGVVLE